MTRTRLLLLLPSTTYRAEAFTAAALRVDADVTVGTDHRSTFGDERPEAFLPLDLSDPARSASQAQEFHGRHPIAAVLGVDDDTTVVAAHIASRLGLRHDSVEACTAARDKHRQRVILAREGVSVPPFALHRFDEDLERVARGAPYPCVIKPTGLAMSRGVMRADTPSEFLERCARLRRILERPDAREACGDGAAVFLVEGFVPGPEVAIECLVRGGAVKVLALFDKPDPLDGPFFEETIYVTPSRHPEEVQRRVAACATRAVAALGLQDGPVHAELRLGPGGPWLIELAARSIGGRCSAVLRFGPRAETSLEELLVRRALGLRIRPLDLEREAAAAAVMMIPVGQGGVLRRVEGASEAKRVPWVDDVVITAHPGQRLVPLPEGSRYLGFIYARAPEPAAAEQAVREAHAWLKVELE